MLKGASRVIGIDRVPERLKKAEEFGVEPLNFSQHTDVVRRLQEIAPGGLDVALDCGKSHVCCVMKLAIHLRNST